MKKLLCLLLSAALLGSLIVAPVSGEATSPTATPSSGTCTCGCGLTLNKVIWQPWDPNTKGNPINGHYYLQADYTHNKQYQVNSGVRMVLDLRGHKLTSQNSRLFLVYGNTAIIDTVGGGRVCASSTGTGNGGAVGVALDGVAMNDEMDATFSLYNCTATLEKGKSGLNGGLFNVGDGAKLKIYNSTLLNASANERGGAIYANKSGAVVEMTDSSIIGCRSTIAGGAIYSIGSVTLKNCKLIGNETDGAGGSLYNSGGSLTIENATIESGVSRSAKDGGGNIYAKNGCRVNISNSIIRNGYAANHGGSVFFGKGTQTLTNTTISAGVSGNQGANLYCADTGAVTTLNNCTVSVMCIIPAAA